ncbi:MAG: hypothetical protein A3E82_05210 [Gammaproteobacteria bacterium RIFCSPHIGHO2_12_FULL_38_11]|nr:MAG: hypothetical protein A3E82_05210 [Gammaproteobacteria bacterium RIFCSPHIGHO2_12_FULL_38_11]
MRFIALTFLCCATVVLSGCGAHSRDYLKKGHEVSPLVVPEGVPILKQEPYYPIPPGPATTEASKPVSLKPPTLGTCTK